MRLIGFLLAILVLLSLISVSHAAQVLAPEVTVVSGSSTLFNVTFINNHNYTENITIQTSLAKIEYQALFSNIVANPNKFSIPPYKSVSADTWSES